MTAIQFCFWLQGFMEISEAGNKTPEGFTSNQRKCIDRHLDLVKKYDPDNTNKFFEWYAGFTKFNYNPGIDKYSTVQLKNILNSCFQHEIDPSYGDSSVQQELNSIHHGPTHLLGHLDSSDSEPKIRC